MKAIKVVLIIVALAAFVAALVTQGPSDLGSFAKRLVTTWWGIPNLIVFLLLLWAWCRQSGTAFVVIVVGLLAGISYGGTFQREVTRLVGESPASWFLATMKWSAERWDTAGWGILILAAVLIVIVTPLTRTAVRYARILQAEGLGTFGDSAEIQRAFQRRGEDYGLGPLLGFVGQMCVGGAAIMLWVALRWFAGSGLPLGFSALGLPDVTVPSFRPVWHWSYFVLAALATIVMLVQVALLKRFDLAAVRPGLTNRGGVIFVMIVAALLVPAGVILYVLGSTVMVMILIPVVAAGQPRYERALQVTAAREEDEEREAPPIILGGPEIAAVLGSDSSESSSSGDAADPFDLLGQLGLDDKNGADPPEGGTKSLG